MGKRKERKRERETERKIKFNKLLYLINKKKSS
jgi:hypothetical protein